MAEPLVPSKGVGLPPSLTSGDTVGVEKEGGQCLLAAQTWVLAQCCPYSKVTWRTSSPSGLSVPVCVRGGLWLCLPVLS